MNFDFCYLYGLQFWHWLELQIRRQNELSWLISLWKTPPVVCQPKQMQSAAFNKQSGTNWHVEAIGLAGRVDRGVQQRHTQNNCILWHHVFNYLMGKLRAKAFNPSTSRKRIHCLIGTFQSLSHKEYKERLLLLFENNGVKRVADASTALGMGVNFPDVRYVVLFGPARSLLDFHQKLGELVKMACLPMLFCIFMANSWHTVRKTYMIF